MSASGIGQTVFETLFALRSDEQVLIFTDSSLRPLASYFADAAETYGGVVSLVEVTDSHRDSEPPPLVCAAMREADVVLIMTWQSYTHTEAVTRLRREGKVRMATMSGINEDAISRCLNIDFNALNQNLEEWKSNLVAYGDFTLKTAEGSQLQFKAQSDAWSVDAGQLKEAGQFANLPSGELYAALESDSLHGRVICDYSLIDNRIRPIRMEVAFKDGQVVHSSHPDIVSVTEGADQKMVAMLCFGANPRAHFNESPHETLKCPGVACLIIGHPGSDGSLVKNRGMMVMTDPVMSHQDKVLLAPRLDPAVMNPDQSQHHLKNMEMEFYHRARQGLISEVFNSSHAPQYVLDLANESFELVNHAFLEMTGYEEKELVGVKVLDSGMISQAEEYQRIRDMRRDSAVQSYRMMARHRSGRLIPLFVQSSVIHSEGRPYVFGTCLDISAVQEDMVKKLEVERDRTRRALDSSLSVYQLFEKIRAAFDAMTDLMQVTDEATLLSVTGELLTDTRGLDCESADFYVREDGMLNPAHSTSGRATRAIDLSRDHRLNRFLRGGATPRDHKADEMVLPLQIGDKSLGLAVVHFGPRPKSEVSQVRSLLEAIVKTLIQSVSLLLDNIRLHNRLRDQAILHPLTGIFNRRYFNDKIANEIDRHRRYGAGFSLLIIDIDHFKKINDRHGHLQGDLVLKELAMLLTKSSRQSDTVCHWGGEEFTILFPEMEENTAADKSEALRLTIEEHPFTNLQDPSTPFKITVSMGVAAAGENPPGVEALMHEADRALYQAKNSGRNCMVLASMLPPEDSAL